MEDNEEENYFLANPVNPNGRVMNNTNNIVENNVNNNINTDINNARKTIGSDKIIISYHLGCFEVGFMFIFSILFIVFPFFFYFLLFRTKFKTIYYVDENENEFISGSQGIFGCCLCCVYERKYYYVKKIRNVQIFVKSKFGSNKNKVDIDFEMSTGEQENFCKDLELNNRKLNEVESFFKRHFYVQVVEK